MQITSGEPAGRRSIFDREARFVFSSRDDAREFNRQKHRWFKQHDYRDASGTLIVEEVV